MRGISTDRNNIVIGSKEGIEDRLGSIRRVYSNVKSGIENDLQSINKHYTEIAKSEKQRLIAKGYSEADAHNAVDDEFGCDFWEAEEFEKGLLETTKRMLLVYMYNAIFEKSIKDWLILFPELHEIRVKIKEKKPVYFEGLHKAVEGKLGIDLKQINYFQQVDDIRKMANKIKHDVFARVSITEDDLLKRFPETIREYFNDLISKTEDKLPSSITFTGMIDGIFIPKEEPPCP